MPVSARRTTSDIPEWLDLALYEQQLGGQRLSRRPYQRYTPSQHAYQPFLENPYLRRYYDMQHMGIGQPHMRRAAEHLEQAAVPFSRTYEQYLDPYLTGRLGDIRREHERAWTERILPSIQQDQIARGIFHTRGPNQARESALRNLTESLQSQQNRLLSEAYGQAGRLHEMESRGYQSLAGQRAGLGQETSRQHYIDLAGQREAGEALYRQRMHVEDLKRQEHERQVGHGLDQSRIYGAGLRGVPVQPSQTQVEYTPPASHPGVMGQLGGLLAGAQSQPRFYSARGGRLTLPKSGSRKTSMYPRRFKFPL